MITPRPYQTQAVDAVFGRFAAGERTLLIMATGLGKTVCFGLIAERWAREQARQRVLVLAHRDELIIQSRDELTGIIGYPPQVEQAESRADPSGVGLFGPASAPAVIASVQTLCQPARLARWPRDEFGLVVVDEAHHATSTSYLRILDHFSAARRLGVTATPQRADNRALGPVFGPVAYDMGILDAVRDAWLVPVRQELVTVSGLDLSEVGTVGDDLNQGQLGTVLTGDRVLDRMVAATVELCGSEPTLVFTAARPPGGTVSQGDVFAEALNRIKPGSAVFLSGETGEDERRQRLRDYEDGKFQYLVGCALFTEGFNSPRISRVVMARPTKSVVYYTQAIGRGTRTLRGVLGDEHDTPEKRAVAVAASKKPDLLVVDFVGNSGRHKLLSCVDVFAGRHSAAAVAKVREAAAGRPVNVLKELDDAEAEVLRELQEQQRLDREERERRRTRVRVDRLDMSRRAVDPFGHDDARGQRQAGDVRSGPATADQLARLTRLGGLPRDGMTAGEAGDMTAECIRRKHAGLCSMKQERVLARAGLATGPVPKLHAGALVTWLKANGWRAGRALGRGDLGIRRTEGKGFQLTIRGVPVGDVYGTADSVRQHYRGLVPEPAVT